MTGIPVHVVVNEPGDGTKFQSVSKRSAEQEKAEREKVGKECRIDTSFYEGKKYY